MKKIVFTKKFMTQSDRAMLKLLLFIILGVIVVYFLLLIILEIIGYGGQARFYQKWIECGQKPVQSHSLYKKFIDYYEETPVLTLMRPSTEYYCSPLEAEKAGVSADSDHDYFPHLEAERNSQ